MSHINVQIIEKFEIGIGDQWVDEWKLCNKEEPPNNVTVKIIGKLNDSSDRWYEHIGWCINGKWLMEDQWLYQSPFYWKEI